MRSGGLSELFHTHRERLQIRLATDLRIANEADADLLLVSADGRKLPAHRCILRQRAPGFFRRHIEPTLAAARAVNAGGLLEVAIGDVDSVALEFFIRSVYTEDEVQQLGAIANTEATPPDRGGGGDGRRLHRTRMDDSSEFSELDEAEQPRGDSFDGKMSNSGSFRRHGHGHGHGQLPTMTSFRELAIESPMTLSTYSEPASRKPSLPLSSHGLDGHGLGNHGLSSHGLGKFVQFDGSCDRLTDAGDEHRDNQVKQQIFPMFFGLGPSDMYKSLPNPLAETGIRARAMAAKRLSVTSLTSLTSIDLTPTYDGPTEEPDNSPSCRLAADLLQMYMDNVDTDLVVKTDNGELHAHRCILSATCPYLNSILQQSKKTKPLEIKGFTKTTVHFFLAFLYGGLTRIPDEVDVWELLNLARKFDMDSLVEVVILHLKSTKCHFFHRPCAGCVSAIFDSLPQFSSISCLENLYHGAMTWQARYFARIWKGRVFLHLNRSWQLACFEALVQQIDEESVIDVFLGCERLQMTLPRAKATAASETVQRFVMDAIDAATAFLVQSFDVVVASENFSVQGKGLCLNLAMLEELLPSLVHHLAVDTAIKAFISLGQSCEKVQRQLWQQHQKTTTNSLTLPINDWNPRFLALLRRLHELVDRHLLQYAASTIKSEAWDLLTEADQGRIKETGLFVELRQPKAPPPRMSSFNRISMYKRSVSAGVSIAPMGAHDRARSLERSARFGLRSHLSDTPETVAEERKETNADPTQTPKSETNIASNVHNKLPQQRSEPPPPSLEKKQSTSIKPVKEVIPEETIDEKRMERQNTSIKPVKEAIPEETIDETRMERQNTHTIMTAPPGTAKPSHLPVAPSPIHKAVDKPKSVVKPMVKASQPITPVKTRSIPRSTRPPSTTTTQSSVASTRPNVVTRSALPIAKTTTDMPKRRIGEREGRKENMIQSRIPRSPKSMRKKNTVEKLEKTN